MLPAAQASRSSRKRAGRAIASSCSSARRKGPKGLDAELVLGDARDEVALFHALDRCEGVISALGTPMSPFREVTLLSAATRVLVSAMQNRNVRRLVCITGMGAGDSRGHGGFFYDRFILPLLLRKVYVDKNRQEDVIRTSRLDWVIVRPSVLNDKPAHGNVRALTDLSSFHGGSIARAEVARFVVAQLGEDRWVGKSPLITW